MMRRIVIALTATVFFSPPFLLTGCANINANAQLGDGYQFQMESRGSKAQVYTQCLTTEQIKAFFPGNKPPGAPDASCYQVFLLTSSNSAITDSMKEFIESKNEFDEILAEILKAKTPAEASAKASTVRSQPPLPADTNTNASVSTAAVSAIASDALANKPEEVQARAETIAKQLSDTQKDAVIDGLNQIKQETPVSNVKEGVDAAIKTLQSN